MLAAARMGDTQSCPALPPLHVGGPILVGDPQVLVGNLPAARTGDPCVCAGSGMTATITTGSSTVFIGGHLAARMTDGTSHNGVITKGDFSVLIGGSAAAESPNESSDTLSDPEQSSDAGNIWNLIRQGVIGLFTVGPIDAYDAGRGDDFDAAVKVQKKYAANDPGGWQQNAARHATWMARLTFKHGSADAKTIGDAHEHGSTQKLDSWVDQHNNTVGRQIGNKVESLSDIPAEVDRAMKDGSLITSPDDPRVPPALREP